MKKSKFAMSAGMACLLALALAGCQTGVDVGKVGPLDVVPDRVAMAPGDTAAAAVVEAVMRNSGYPLITQPVDGKMGEFCGVYARTAGPDKVIVTYGHGVYPLAYAEPLTAAYLASRHQTSTTFEVTVSPNGGKASISPDAKVSRLFGLGSIDMPAVASTDTLARDLRQALSSAN